MSVAIYTPVLIAGGGPVGLACAMDLAWRGIKSIVIEARAQLPASPRCNTTNARTMEIFRRLGCADAVRAAGLPHEHSADVVYMTSFNGHELHRFARPTAAQVIAGTGTGISSDWPTPEPQHFISQLYMEPVLRRHAREHFGIDLRLGVELLDLQQDANGVTANVRDNNHRGAAGTYTDNDTSAGSTTTLRSAYLVSADGSNSVVRRAINARLEGIPRIGDTCSVFVRSRRLTELYREHPGWMYRFVGGLVLVAINGIDEWLMHMSPPSSIAIEDFNPEPVMFAAIGEPFDYEVINLVRWTARAMVCNKFRDDRVFLAGDAAHIWIPMGGFGMNAGVADGVSLSWRLAGVLQGWLDPKALDSYETERIPIGTRVANQAVRWGAGSRSLLQLPNAQRQALLDDEQARQTHGRKIAAVNGSEWQNVGMQLGYAYSDSAMIDASCGAAPPFTLEQYIESSAPGARAPHLWLEAGVGQQRKALFDVLGKDMTLLRIGAQAPAAAALIAAFAARTVPLTVVALPQDKALRTYEGWPLVLVRPDQHIVWRGQDEPTAIDELIDRITGRLMPQPPVAVINSRALPHPIAASTAMLQRRGRLIVSDRRRCELRWLDPFSTRAGLIFTVTQEPGAIGFLPSGRMLLVSQADACVNIAEDGFLNLYADLFGLAAGRLGAMAIDREGAIYLCDQGAPTTQSFGRIIRIGTDKRARIVADGLHQPSGLAITPDSSSLLISQGSQPQILQCRIQLDGDLSKPRPYIDLDRHCDGASSIAIERDGAPWVCLPKLQRVDRYDKAARLSAQVTVTQGTPSLCVLSNDEHQLFIAGWLATAQWRKT